MKKIKLLFLSCLSVFISMSAKPFTLGEGSLELLDFSVIQNMNKIDIRWSTSVLKTGGPYFSIEKSKDGKNFTKLIDMPAVENESTFTDYFETDYQPYEGVSYYRIKQIDAAGNFRYSQIVTLKIEEEKKVDEYDAVSSVSPESFKEMNVEDSEILLVLRDKNGNDYYSKASINSDNSNVNTINLACPVTSGTYQIIGSSNEKLHSQNVFIK